MFVAVDFEFTTENYSNQEMGNQLVRLNYSAAHRVENLATDLLPDV